MGHTFIGKKLIIGLLSLAILASSAGCSAVGTETAESSAGTVSTTSEATTQYKLDQSEDGTATESDKSGKGTGTEEKDKEESSSEKSNEEIVYLSAEELIAEYSNFDLQTPEDWSNILEFDLDQLSGEVTISEGGVYRLTGSLNGSLTIEAPEDAKVVLMMDGCTITSTDAPAIQVNSADKVMIYTMEDSENTIIDNRNAAEDEDAEGAAIYSTCALVLSGEGLLQVEGHYNNGIQSKKSVKMISGSVEVTAANHGIKAKNNILIKDGFLTVDAGEDALKTTEDDPDGGLIYVEGGSLVLTSVEDGMDASNYLKITGGTVQVTTTAPVSSSSGNQQQWGFPGGMGGQQGGFPGGMGGQQGGFPGGMGGQQQGGFPGGMGGQQQGGFPGGMGGQQGGFPGSMGGQQGGFPGGMNGQQPGEMPSDTSGQMPGEMPSDMSGQMPGEMPSDMSGQMPGQIPESTDPQQTGTQQASDDVSAKGLKAEVLIVISGGSIQINSTDDGIHSDGELLISDGEITIQSQDDGIHADEKVEINGGTMTISAGEGIEATAVLIHDGKITIQATDDGINAAQKSTAYSPVIEITGGTIDVTMGAGDTDGLDSNGNIIISGGTISIQGNSAFDYVGNVSFTGGTVYVNGQQVTTITNQFGGMGGGQRPEGGRR
ncbi:MAG: carbohydrate-binding domain-containing protein [Firmicutes bacterium]|nr:carbohydrate-binding domain-containing protein [Bacillota bacterium]